MTDYDQGLSGGKFGKVLALTATPFDLTPHEMIQLYALVRANKRDLETIQKGLDQYVRQLDAFFAFRERSITDPLRREAVRRLNRLRDEDALGDGTQGIGLQDLLRRYMIRNTKSQNERRCFFVNQVSKQFEMQQFDKLDDLRRTIQGCSLAPLRRTRCPVLSGTSRTHRRNNRKGPEGSDHRTFVTTDLRQGLSSYPQLARSALLSRNLDSAKRLKRLVNAWNSGKSMKLHPKVRGGNRPGRDRESPRHADKLVLKGFDL
jgi:hypothetical protein